MIDMRRTRGQINRGKEKSQDLHKQLVRKPEKPRNRITEKVKVEFQPKSQFQKDECINQNANFKCRNKSTLEAVCTGKSTTPRIRCCTNETCKKVASGMAQLSASI